MKQTRKKKLFKTGGNTTGGGTTTTPTTVVIKSSEVNPYITPQGAGNTGYLDLRDQYAMAKKYLNIPYDEATWQKLGADEKQKLNHMVYEKLGFTKTATGSYTSNGQPNKFKYGGPTGGDTKGQAYWEQALLQKQKEMSPDNPNMKFDPIKFAKKQQQAGEAMRMLQTYYPESEILKAQSEVAKQAGMQVLKRGLDNAALKFDMGGAIGSAVGTALQFVPGVGPILSKIATPLLQAAGSAIDKSDAAPDKVGINSPVAKTINPFGNYKFGGNIYADGGSLDPKSVYDYLISKGMSKEHALGMLANIKGESGFNAAAVGDNGTSGGLFQHHATRFDALKKYAGDSWSTNWQKQIDYALTEKDTKNYLAQTFKTPEEATTWFTKNWERPANADTKAAERVKNLQHFTFASEVPEVPVDTLAPMITDINPTVATESTGTTLQAYQNYVTPNATATVNRFAKKQYGGPINPNMVITSGGQFEDFGSNILYAKGKSHDEGGIKIDTKGMQGFDGLANIEVEHGELISKEGYVIPADKAKPFVGMFKRLAERKDSVSDNTRKLIFSDLAKKTEADLIAKGKAAAPQFSGGGLALAQTLGNISRTIIQPELDYQLAKFPATGTTDIVDPNIAPVGNSMTPGLVQSGFGSYLSGKFEAPGTTYSKDGNTGSSDFKTPAGDIAQLIGMGVTTAYNLGRGLFDKADQYAPDYNEYEDQYANLKQSINLEPMRNAARQQFSTGLSRINNSTSSASTRLGNVQNLYGNFNQNMNELEMKSQEMNNRYAAEQSSRMYSVGAARQAARVATDQVNWANMVAKDQYISEGISNLSQGLTEFGKQRNSQASNELGLRILNDAFPDYYWNTDVVNGIVSGQKPSWMSQDDFAKAKLLLYKKGYNVKLD